MFGKNGTQDQRTENIESLVNNAMGNSVTPSQLLKSNRVGFFRRLLGNKPVEGPFISDLEEDEQPHYLLHSTSLLDFPEEDEVQDNQYSLFGRSIISPVVLIVTDRRSIFVYGSGDSRRTISAEHSDVIDVEFDDLRAEKDLQLHTTQRQIGFGMWMTDPHASEVSDAAAYIFQQSGLDGEYRSYDFDSDGFSSARSALTEELRAFQGLSERVDIEYVAKCAVKGARIGAPRSGYAAVTGFMLGAGYGIWSDLYAQADAQDVVDDIDPDETAEVVLRWQQIGKVHGNRRMELASGALGAAFAIDKQTSGRKVSSVLTDLDIEWASRQLEAGNATEASLQIASDAVESYSSELAGLLEDDFFRQISSDM